MNFKKLVSIALAAQLVFAQAAAATLENTSAKMNSEGTAAIIQGDVNQTGGAASEILVKVLMPGYEDGDVTAANILTSVLAVESVEVNAQNKFTTTIGIPTTLHGRPAPDGKYYVYFSGEGIDAPAAPTELWYVTEGTVNDVITYIKTTAASADDVKTKLFDNLLGLDYSNADMIGLTDSLYTAVAGEVTAAALQDAVATVLYNDKAQLSDGASLKNMVKAAIVMKAFDESKSAVLTGADKNFTVDIFATGDADSAETLYADNVTTAGKTEVLTALSGNGYVTATATSKTDAFAKAFTRQVVYGAVFNYMEEGVAQLGHQHIPGVLTTYGTNVYTNVAAFGAVTPETQLSHAYQLLISGVATPAALDSKIYALLNPTPADPDPDGGDNGGYWGGTGVQGGEYLENLKNESDAREETDLAGFNDIADYGWAKNAIDYLADKNIIVGTSATTFEPARGVKRGEFAKILVLALGYDISDAKSDFIDVMNSAWYAPYVVTLKEMGLAEGSGNGYFNPEASITREEVCTLIYRALGDKLEKEGAVTYGDSANISDFAKDAVVALSASGIIKGNEDGTFLPQNTTTRAEAAVMFYRMLTQGGLV